MKKLLYIMLILTNWLIFNSAASWATEKVSQTQIFVSLEDANNKSGLSNYRLYTMNPDGSQLTPLFDFSKHPVSPNAKIFNLRMTPDNKHLLFDSNHANLYTPTDYNLFRLNLKNRTARQLTPGPNSGEFNQSCPCGTVTGTVTSSNGQAYSGGIIVYIEGLKKSATVDTSGRFRFDNVPVGVRVVIAYRTQNLKFDWTSVIVQANKTSDISLKPNTFTKTNFREPVQFENRIYFRLGVNEISWLDSKNIGTGNSNVYKSQICDGSLLNIGKITKRRSFLCCHQSL